MSVYEEKKRLKRRLSKWVERTPVLVHLRGSEGFPNEE